VRVLSTEWRIKSAANDGSWETSSRWRI